MATVVAGASIDLVRLTVEGNDLCCEVILLVDGDAVALGFRHRPAGRTVEQILSELLVKLRGIAAHVRSQNAEGDAQAACHLAGMLVDLEVALTGASL